MKENSKCAVFAAVSAEWTAGIQAIENVEAFEQKATSELPFLRQFRSDGAAVVADGAVPYDEHEGPEKNYIVSSRLEMVLGKQTLSS